MCRVLVLVIRQVGVHKKYVSNSSSTVFSSSAIRVLILSLVLSCRVLSNNTINSTTSLPAIASFSPQPCWLLTASSYAQTAAKHSGLACFR